jgi:hypothetical protein
MKNNIQFLRILFTSMLLFCVLLLFVLFRMWTTSTQHHFDDEPLSRDVLNVFPENVIFPETVAPLPDTELPPALVTPLPSIRTVSEDEYARLRQAWILLSEEYGIVATSTEMYRLEYQPSAEVIFLTVTSDSYADGLHIAMQQLAQDIGVTVEELCSFPIATRVQNWETNYLIQDREFSYCN